MESVVIDQQELISVLSPAGNPPKLERKTAANRPADLDGKTIFLVDCRFDDSIKLLEQVKAWFADNMPSVDVRIVSLNAQYAEDDPVTWEVIKEHGAGAILGVGHCSACTPAVVAHTISLETRYGIPSVAIHTDKFDKVARSVARVGGLPDLRFAYVPQPVMGMPDEVLRAYVDGDDPLTGRPVMEEVIEALTGPAA